MAAVAVTVKSSDSVKGDVIVTQPVQGMVQGDVVVEVQSAVVVEVQGLGLGSGKRDVTVTETVRETCLTLLLWNAGYGLGLGNSYGIDSGTSIMEVQGWVRS